MDGNVLTISRGTWMELANLEYRQWEEMCARDQHNTGTTTQKRASVANVARYYHDYVDIKGLRGNFKDSALVTSVRRLDHASKGSKDGLWEVTGHVRTSEGLEEDFCYVTPNVVLAIGGYDLPNQMNVQGEDLPFVVKSLQAMEQLITSQQLTSKSDPVLIVGAGLSAADAIIAAHFRGIPIIHAFRKKAEDPSLIFRQLPSNMYPEYHKVISIILKVKLHI